MAAGLVWHDHRVRVCAAKHKTKERNVGGGRGSQQCDITGQSSSPESTRKYREEPESHKIQRFVQNKLSAHVFLFVFFLLVCKRTKWGFARRKVNLSQTCCHEMGLLSREETIEPEKNDLPGGRRPFSFSPCQELQLPGLCYGGEPWKNRLSGCCSAVTDSDEYDLNELRASDLVIAWSPLELQNDSLKAISMTSTEVSSSPRLFLPVLKETQRYSINV